MSVSAVAQGSKGLCLVGGGKWALAPRRCVCGFCLSYFLSLLYKREGRERESDSCFYLGCRCNAFGPNAKCLGHTRFIQIDSALLSGNGLLKVNFRISSTTATRLSPSASLGRTDFFFFFVFSFWIFFEGCVSGDFQFSSVPVFLTLCVCRRVQIMCMCVRV